jgi:hypothetical protein
MGERNDVNRPAHEPGEEQDAASQRGGYRIPGRDFAGASYGSTEREQTADHRGEGHAHRSRDEAALGRQLSALGRHLALAES